jgi:biopolymer transport protein ExbB
MDETAASAVAGLSVIDLIHQGWYATYPLILFSVIVLSVLLERLWTLRRAGGAIESLTDQVSAALRGGDMAAANDLLQKRAPQSPAAHVYAPLIGLLRTGEDAEGLLECGERRRLDASRTMRRNVWVLGTVAASAPFIGLFGTVIGIIKSFHQMALMGTGGFAVVAAGISEALVATALGLLVAIVALLFFNYLQVKIGNLESMLRSGLGRIVEAAMLGGLHGAR